MSNAALPFLSFRALEVAMLPARIGRISFTGELGYEIYVGPESAVQVWDALVRAGEGHGIAPAGVRLDRRLDIEVIGDAALFVPPGD